MRPFPVAVTLFLTSLSSTEALAQTGGGSGPKPITAPVRELHYRLDPTGARAQRVTAAVGSFDVLYDNTCASGYYHSLSPASATGGTQAQALVGQGRLPDKDSPQSAGCWPGVADQYLITELELSYCTTTGSAVDQIVRFWTSLGADCPDVLAFTPDKVLTVTGLPRSPSAGTLACYSITLDLGLEAFELQGGASDTTAERFAWSVQFPGTTGSDGPSLAGDPSPQGCAPCVGTIFERPSQSALPGTGLGTKGSLWLEEFGGAATGCLAPSGPPFLAMHLELRGTYALCLTDACPGTGFCNQSDGAHASCPCGASDPSAGCDIAQGPGVQLGVAAQTIAPNGATLVGAGYPPAATPTAIVIRGNNQEPVPVSFGDGLRCVGLQGFARLAATSAVGGVSTHALGHSAGPGVFYYQLWFRNTPASYCVTSGPSGGAFNLSNGRSLTW